MTNLTIDSSEPMRGLSNMTKLSETELRIHVELNFQTLQPSLTSTSLTSNLMAGTLTKKSSLHPVHRHGSNLLSASVNPVTNRMWENVPAVLKPAVMCMSAHMSRTEKLCAQRHTEAKHYKESKPKSI